MTAIDWFALLHPVLVVLFVYPVVGATIRLGILVRELLISVGTLWLAAKGARRIDVQWVGKAGTLALMFALPLFLWLVATRRAFFTGDS